MHWSKANAASPIIVPNKKRIPLNSCGDATILSNSLPDLRERRRLADFMGGCYRRGKLGARPSRRVEDVLRPAGARIRDPAISCSRGSTADRLTGGFNTRKPWNSTVALKLAQEIQEAPIVLRGHIKCLHQLFVAATSVLKPHAHNQPDVVTRGRAP